MFEDKIFYKGNLRIFLFVISFFLAIIVISGAVSAADLTVNPGDSIQTAVMKIMK